MVVFLRVVALCPLGVLCPPKEDVYNSTHTNTTWRYPETVKFTCDPGFQVGNLEPVGLPSVFASVCSYETGYLYFSICKKI